MGARVKVVEKSAIVSVRLSVNAYKKTGNLFDRSKTRVWAARRPDITATSYSAVNSAKLAREQKASVLRSLQGKSNSGLVNMRDVAVALDNLLKNR